MIRSAPFLILLAVLAPSCSRTQNDTATREDATSTPAKRAFDTTGGLTGAISEEEFKALHKLTTEKAPMPRGVDIEVAGTRAYLSLPEHARPPIPGLVVIHEWWGLNDHIRHWTDRLASDGYAALAVDLYGGRVADSPDSAMALMKALDEARALQILRAAYDTLGSDPRIAATKRGSIGWCFGGGWSLQTALDVRKLDATVVYYGRLVTDPAAYQGMKTPILGIFGNRDPSITPETVNQFEKALEDAGVPHEIYRFDATHAFANPSGANYNQEAAAQAWERTRSFLAKYLKQG